MKDPNRPRCGFAKRDGNGCGAPAGWGTDHLGTGGCRYHDVVDGKRVKHVPVKKNVKDPSRVRCEARKKDGKLCRSPAGLGTNHKGISNCKKHGGNFPPIIKAAQKEMLRRAVNTFGLPRDVAPDVALLEEVHRTAGHVAWLAEEIAKLEADKVVWGVTEEIDRPHVIGVDKDGWGGGTEIKRKAVPHGLIGIYQQERRHLVQVCKAALDAGVSERIVTVFEQIGTTYNKMIDRILIELDLTEEQRAKVPEVMQRELRSIASGQ